MNMHRNPINKAVTISFLWDLYEPFYLCIIYSCEKIQVHVLESHVMRMMSWDFDRSTLAFVKEMN